MAYSILDRVYSIFIDIMTGISAGSGSATFYNTDKNTSYIELTVTNGVQSFNMSEYNYILVVNKPDKTSYKNSYSTTDNEKLVIALDSDMLSGIGTNSAQLYIMKSVDSVDKVITMIEFNYIVKPANYKELAPASKDSDSLYISLRNDVDSILSKIENGEIGSGGSGMTVTQKEQLATAYNHAMSDAVTTTDVVNSAVATYVEANKDTLKGDKGDTGAKGDKGEKGDTGAKGADGAKGDKGDKGDPFTYSDFTPEQLAALKGAKGDKGDAGAKGANGITPTLRVGSTSTGNAGTNANVTMTDNNNVYTLNFVIPRGDKGEAGVKGQDGAKGADGITPTLKVGTVTTLAAGSNATVTMSKNNNEYTLNFGIPKGNKGDTGASGSGGETTVVNPTITIGTVTNGDTASATITGDSPNYTLNLVLPKGAKGDKGDTGAAGTNGAKGDKGDKGEKGDTGAKGADGQTPTFEVGTVSTGAAGSTATVTITGTAPNYVLNFTIPKGDKGDAGEAGSGGNVDLTGYAKLAGATFTGKISSPIVSATRYFETPTLVGEGDDSTYYHRVVFGHRNFDRMEFHEYGGLFKFFENKSGSEADARLLFQITPTGVDSSVDLKERGARVYSPNNKPTAADLGITVTKGDKGDKGDPFTYADFTPEQLAALKGAKGDAGAKGEKGDAGAKGADGVTPTLSIGTVTTGAAGSSASVTMGGTAPSYVLNFTIPKGDKGDKGDTGAAGSGSSSSSSGGIVFEDSYVSNANQWLTNGYTKTSGTATSNLPAVCSATKDRWGILFFIAENAANGTGTQMFFPIDGKYMGKIFTRSIVGGTRPANPDTKFGTWAMLASEDTIIEAVNGTSGAITLSDRMYQRVDATGNITITLPALNKSDNIYKEIHLFYWSEGTHTVTVASASSDIKVLWESIPTVEANAITEFIFKKKNNAWMCKGITYRQQS